MLPLTFLADDLQSLANDNLLRRRRITRWLSDGRCEVDGQCVWNFIGNDYLNLAGDPRVISAAEQALREAGVGSRASALLGGRTDWHARLERRIAQFEGTESAILFPTGMAANVGTLSALIQQDDIIFCDRFNHASLVDGCRLSGAKLRVYRHDDLAMLERELDKLAGLSSYQLGAMPLGAGLPTPPFSPSEGLHPQHQSGSSANSTRVTDRPLSLALSPEAGARGHKRRPSRIWIVTDGVFSMDGDLAPLPGLCELAEKYGAEIIVDEAHATGVFGATGRGVAEHFGVEQRIAVRTGTLSKAVGCLGGFVAGSQTLIDYLWNSARTQIYSTALPPAVCAAAEAAITILQQEPDRICELHERSQRFRAELAADGVTVMPGSIGPIVPIVLHDSHRAVILAERLETCGFLVGAIRPPTVPRGTSRLRISISLSVPVEQITNLAAAVVAEFSQASA